MKLSQEFSSALKVPSIGRLRGKAVAALAMQCSGSETAQGHGSQGPRRG